MSNAIISYGPKLGLLNNATIGEVYYDQFRPFLRGMDALVQISAISFAATPPVSPSNGDTYIISDDGESGPQGEWAGKLNQIAVYSTQITEHGNNTLTPGWEYYIPNPGWIAFVYDRSGLVYDTNGPTGFMGFNYYYNSWLPLMAPAQKIYFTSEVAGDCTIDVSFAGFTRSTSSVIPVMSSDGHVWNPELNPYSGTLTYTASDVGISGYFLVS